MKRRLYWMLPDLSAARSTANDLLLARIGDRSMHFMSKRGTDFGDLHEASILQKTDLRHAGTQGALTGCALGALTAAILALVPETRDLVGPFTMLMMIFCGGMFGFWASSLVGVSVFNSKLKRFEKDLDEGRVLLILDVPVRRVEEIRNLLQARHPEAEWGGQEATMPAFP